MPARLRRPPAVPPRPADPHPAARAGHGADHQRERRHRQRRDPLRRQRPTGRARRPQHRRRGARAAHRPRRPVHRRPAGRSRRRARDPGAAPTTRCSRSGPGARGSERGSGGMASKLEAARIASWSGVRTVIANAARPGVLAGAVADEAVGTSFAAHRPQARRPQAVDRLRRPRRRAVTVDDGARTALVERPTSLLPAGVVDVAGRFGEGDTVDVVGIDGIAVRPRHGVRRGGAAAQGGRPPHQRTPRRAWSTRSSTATTSSCSPADSIRVFRGHRVFARGRTRLRRVKTLGWSRPGLLGGLLAGCSTGCRLQPARRLQAELGAQLAEPALGLDVGRRLLDLEHAATRRTSR